MPSRRGRKSAAQKPAPKAERIYGSKKNTAGSADTGKSVTLSSKTINTLKNKLSEFKEKYPNKKNVSLNDMKAVYRRGSGAYSKSHRPTITGGAPNSRAAWSYARVNKFLQKAAGLKVKKAYIQDDDLLKRGGEIDPKAFDLVFYHEEEGNWLFAKNKIYVWLYDDLDAGTKLQSGEYDWIIFPPRASIYAAFKKNYVAPLKAVWTKKYQKDKKGSDKLVGIVEAYYDEAEKKLYILMMTTRKDYQRRGVNFYLIKFLREHFKLEKDQVVFDKPTEEGKKFEASGKFEEGGDLLEQGRVLPELTNQELNFLKGFMEEVSGSDNPMLLRKFMSNDEIKSANSLVKKGYMAKGTSDEKNGSVMYYLDLTSNERRNIESKFAEGGKTFNNKELLEKYNAGESIGFTATAHLKAKGLIERADGTKRKSDEYLADGGETTNVNNKEILDEGKKYFPKLKEIDGRYYLNYPKNKGSFSESGFKNHLVAYKIEKVIDWLNAKNITYSNSSQSVYFTLNGKNFRISDHKKSFDGIDITIKWNTPIEDIMQNKTLYHGSPYEFTEFSELNIGTGEGNQKYGKGFYFTESPEVAQRYSLVPSDNSFYINAVKLKDDSSLSDNDKLTILSIWRQKWEEGYSETKEDYISEILNELQKSSLGFSKEELTQQFGEDLFTEEEFAELNANTETYKRLYEYLSSANLKIKSYIYEVKLNTDHLYFAEGETEEVPDESYDGLYYNYPYQEGIKNYVIFSSKNFYIISKNIFKMGGNIDQQIECVGCGWKWNTADSDSSDMYVCHKCGFDNSLFYETANILKPTLTIEEIADKHYVHIGYIENQLDKGKEHEMEHTDNEEVAEKIALHHLAETPDYYEKLEEMKLEDGGLTINAEPIDYQQYLIEQKNEASEVLMCTDTRIFKVMICKSKIELAEKNIESTDVPLEKNVWNECIIIWKKCMNDVHKNNIPKMKEGGQPCGCGKIYAKGGLAYGNSHDKGGMPMTVKSTGQSIEIEGGEGVINKRSMQMTKKVNFEGKRLTPCEVISKINQMGGGVKFKCDDVKEIIDADGSF